MPFAGPSSVGPTVTSSVLSTKIILDVGNEIAYLEPSEAPFLRLLTPASDGRGVIRKTSCHNPKFEWLEQTGVPRWDAVNCAGGYTAADTSVIVDHGSYFDVGYLILVPRTGEVMQVSAVTTNTLTVVRGGGAGTLVDNEPLLCMHYTSAEGALSPAIKVNQETQPYNYTEILKTAVGVTETLKYTDLYGGDDLTSQRLYKSIEHAMDIEHRLLFGYRNIVGTAADVNATRYTGGITYYNTTNSTTLTATMTESDWTAWLQTFHYWGSPMKVVFCAGNVIQALNDFAIGHLRLNDAATKKYGMDINEWVSAYGTTYLIYHKLLYGATNGKKAIGIDLSNIKYRFLQNRDTKLETNIQAPDADYEKDQYISEFGLEFRLPQTHSILNLA